MIKKNILILISTFLFIGCTPSQQQKEEQATPIRPNIVIVMVDDMGWADVGFNGCKDIPTPNIDQIANKGVRFPEGYVTFPVCGPSRAGFLTGRYQDRFGFTSNPSIDPKNPIAGLPVEEETIAQVLKKANYQSAIIGKWHMGTHPNFHPLERGFDYFFGFLSGGHRYFPDQLDIKDLSEVTQKWQWYRTQIIENRKPVETQEYLTDELSNAAVKFIKNQADANQHFMLFLSYNAPHTPMQATEKYLSRFPNIEDKKRKTYAAMVSAVDDGVGQVLNTLKNVDILDNTLIVFLSDNGGAKNNASDNGPLRGRKGDLFEGGVRVPFAMRWDGVIPTGKTYEKPVSSLDIMATVVEVNKIQVDKERPLDGVNLIPYLTGNKEGMPHNYLFWRKWEKNAMAIRHNYYKMVANSNQDTLPPKLYNLGLSDEFTDVSEQKRLTYDSLITEWNHWNGQLRDRIFPTLSTDVWWTNN
ncbi:MAG: sulfatase-like hydrolase/transferase [Bacteroidota bacterium]